MPALLPRGLLLACLLAVTARASSLVSVSTTPLSSADVAARPVLAPAEYTLLATTVPLGVPLAGTILPGLAADLTPLTAAVQDNTLYVLARAAGGGTVLLRRAADGWEPRAAPPAAVFPAAVVVGQSHLCFLQPDSAAGRTRVLTYHAITDTWAELGSWPGAGEITAVRGTTDGCLVQGRDPGGAPRAWSVTLVAPKRSLGWIDWSIILVYLAGSAAVGLYFYARSKKQDNADFFLGGRSIPWWAAGVSLYATGTSAISYLAIPAKSYATNWLYFAANLIGLFGTVFTAVWVVPLIRRLNLMSVYQYLELRFHPNIRVLSSAIAIILQLGGRMSIVLFLPSLAMSAVTGVGVIPSILIMGVVTILYTALGGMRAVIWTDFIQAFVMLGGAFYAIGYIVRHVPGGVAGFLHTAMADQKFRTFDWSFDLTQATVWGFLLVTILGVLTYPQDQVMMQRVLATKSDREAGWSMWTLAAIVAPGSLTFFGIGTALYVYYKAHPERLNPLLPTDSVFPQFIAGELPVGVTGLIIAGIFAASMSTLASCINSVATLVSVDFYERYARNPTPERSVRLAEWMTLVGGAIGVGAAVLLALVDIQSALDKSYELTFLFGGGFAGCYALGMFTRRANWQGAAVGVGASIVITLVAWACHLVHPYFYSVIAIASCILVGYAASLCFPPPSQSLLGLTVFTPRPAPAAA